MSKNNNIEQIFYRVNLAFILLLLFVGLVFFSMINLNFVNADHYRNITDSISAIYREYQPERGDIKDADGNILATTILAYDVDFDVNTSQLGDSLYNADKDSLAIRLAEFNKTYTAKEYVEIFDRVRKNPNERVVAIARDITPFEFEMLKTFPILREKSRWRSGLSETPIYKRRLPYGELLKRTIGSVREERGVVGLFGESGLEGYYDEEISGKPYLVKMKKIGSFAKPISDDNKQHIEKGYDLISTIDINLQDFAHRTVEKQLYATEAEAATLVVMETETGHIKAIVNLKNNKDSTVSEVQNYAAGYNQAPGSTFKVPIMIAAMEDGHFNSDDVINTSPGTVRLFGETISDGRNLGSLNAMEIITYSSNVGMAKIVDRFYSNDQSALMRRLFDMRLAEKTGLDVMGEQTPTLIAEKQDERKNQFTFVSMAYGYGVSVTPISTLTFYNALANDGYRVKPRIIKSFEKHGQIVKEFNDYETDPELICSRPTLDAIRKALTDVVKNRRGTAHNIHTDRYQIAGKTGTAKKYSAEKKRFEEIYRASFVGYFPADKPKYSMIVVFYGTTGEKSAGGAVAAPVFRTVADRIYNRDPELNGREHFPKVEHVDAPYSKSGNRHDIDKVLIDLGIAFAVNDKYKGNWVRTEKDRFMVEYHDMNLERAKVPSVLDMSAKDAVYLLEASGLQVSVSGVGTVRYQSVQPGTSVKENMQIKIELR